MVANSGDRLELFDIGGSLYIARGVGHRIQTDKVVLSYFFSLSLKDP
jgi:hypothetical protein